ncbi:MAG: hypothetical protein OEU50_22575 [Gammaproteobacteria bacterium]|nr:hypothetical protein [Gammaproteobacteria bacterium]
MKHQSGFYRVATAVLISILGIGLSSSIQAAPVVVNLQGQSLTDDTGYLLENLSNETGDPSVEILSGDPGFNFAVPQGFVLLDTTLHVKPDLKAGKRRIRARIDYGRYYGGRAGIRKLGIRANTLRLLRANSASRRWVRAGNGIRATNLGIRYGRTTLAGLLGQQGLDTENEVVWAVLDTKGEQFFALAGLSNVPLPAGWLLFMSGSGLLLLVSRKKSRSRA